MKRGRPPLRDSTGVRAAETGEGHDKRSPMSRFRDLARGLANVSRDDFKREEERYAIENAARKSDKKLPDT